MSAADSLYQAAVLDTGQVSVKESLKAFRRVVDADRKYAPAYNQIARLYLKLDNPTDRLRAKYAIKEAIRLDAKNLAYRLTLAEVIWAQGFFGNSAEYYKKIQARHGESADAAYWAGYYALSEYMNTKDRVRVVSTNNMFMEGTTFSSVGLSPEEAERQQRSRFIEREIPADVVTLSFKPFAEKDLKHTFEFMEEAIQIDPGYRDAYYQMGLAYLESNRPEEMVRLMQRLLEQCPDDKDAWLFCGLGYLTMGQMAKADGCFSYAIAYMTPQERFVMESADLVAAEAERERLARAASLAGSGAEGFWLDPPEIERFWKRQDPVLLTRFNERRMEHYGRVAYANLAFSRPWKDVTGWQTDRGKTYIKFGRYLFRRAGMGLAGYSETWHYDGFKVTFWSPDGITGWAFSPWAGTSSASVMADHPPRYVDPFGKQKYRMPHLVAAFQDGGKIRLEVAYAVPKDRVERSDPEGFVHLDEGIFFLDEHLDEVYRKQDVTTELAEAGTDSVRRNYLMSHRGFTIAPGAYQLVVEVGDRRKGSIGTFREMRTLSVADTGLAMSDLLLAGHIQTLTPFPEGRTDLKMTPNPLRTYRRRDPVFIYLEVYNLTRDVFGRTDYEISYRVGRPKKEEAEEALFEAADMPEYAGTLEVEAVVDDGTNGIEDEDRDDEVDVDYRVTYRLPERNRILEAIGRLFGKREETAITARYEGDREDDFTYLQIDVAQAPPGVHKLRVTVRDVRTEREVERGVLFRVVE